MAEGGAQLIEARITYREPDKFFLRLRSSNASAIPFPTSLRSATFPQWGKELEYLNRLSRFLPIFQKRGQTLIRQRMVGEVLDDRGRGRDDVSSDQGALFDVIDRAD